MKKRECRYCLQEGRLLRRLTQSLNMLALSKHGGGRRDEDLMGVQTVSAGGLIAPQAFSISRQACYQQA